MKKPSKPTAHHAKARASHTAKSAKSAHHAKRRVVHKVSHRAAVLRAKKAAATRKKRKATLGGECAWEAFGVRRPWYMPRAARLEWVAKRAGYVRGPVRKGGVAGLTITAGGLTGYHAARVLAAGKEVATLDLWGATTFVLLNEITESWVPA